MNSQEVMDHWEDNYSLQDILPKIKSGIGVEEWLKLGTKEECTKLIPALEELEEYEVILLIKEMYTD